MLVQQRQDHLVFRQVVQVGVLETCASWSVGDICSILNIFYSITNSGIIGCMMKLQFILEGCSSKLAHRWALACSYCLSAAHPLCFFGIGVIVAVAVAVAVGATNSTNSASSPTVMVFTYSTSVMVDV
jgi:hypothetical protein